VTQHRIGLHPPLAAAIMCSSRTARDIAQTPSEMVLSRVWKANKIIPLIEENRKVWYDAQRRTTE
jgi:hypothetical protein